MYIYITGSNAYPDAYRRELAEPFDCSILSIHQRLKQLNITYKKTFTYSKKSEADRVEYFKKTERIPKKNRIYVDESGIDRHLVREFGRAVRGVKIEDVKRGKKYQRVNVVAGQFEHSSGELCYAAPFCYTENMVGDLFENCFKTKLVKSIAKGSTIIMDSFLGISTVLLDTLPITNTLDLYDASSK